MSANTGAGLVRGVVMTARSSLVEEEIVEEDPSRYIS